MRHGPFRHPLDWPASQKRWRGEHIWGPYKVTLDRAQRDLVDELDKLGAQDVVVSTDMRTRRDGMIHASAGRPNDVGVAVYWTRDGNDFVMACDRYRDVRSNVRACGLAIHHLRRLEQAAPGFAEAAFSGFARLPATAGPDGSRPWRDVLDVPANVRLGVDFGEEQIVARFKELARRRHPDNGGSHAAMSELNRAAKEARAELERALKARASA